MPKFILIAFYYRIHALFWIQCSIYCYFKTQLILKLQLESSLYTHSYPKFINLILEKI